MSGPVTPLGLPEALPHGEVILWQGRPSWQSMALRAFHIRAIGIYFVALFVATAVFGLARGSTTGEIASGLGWLLLIGSGAVGVATGLAFIYSRTSIYTVTNRRLVLRYGAALPITLNLPFRIIGSAAAKVHADGTADIPVTLTGEGRITYLHLWPHARPWRLSKPEPMLRSVPDGARVAALIAEALDSAPPVPVAEQMTVPAFSDRDAATLVAA